MPGSASKSKSAFCARRGKSPSFMPSRHTTRNGTARIGIKVQKVTPPETN